MTGEAHLPMGMGAVMLAGGLMGYVKGKSIPSLVAGTMFGTGYFISGWLISKNDAKNGHMLALGLSSLLAVGMGARALNTKKPVPIAVSSLGAITGAYHGFKTVEWWDS